LKKSNFFPERCLPLLLADDLMLVLKDAFPDSEILKDTNLTRKKIPTIITDIIHPQIKLNLY